ncbi:MAG TPA: polyprenyl synthetase family protein [Candidatus Wallbacteria bacterium]|nr:polyprenyl synthetase family protein [Candidatus Wallbacteria bacterium]
MYIDYNENLTEVIKDYKKAVDKCLDQLLPPENTMPNKLHEAMRYSVFAGGKRIRPVITMLCCKLFSGNLEDALPVAAAIEMIHTYSLIHDDLPAMDNDDFRRGKPTSHKVYGEAVAILAGDALLTKAFEVLAKVPKTTSIKPDVANLIIETVAGAAGNLSMIGGQVMDIMSEAAAGSEKKISELVLFEIHKRKTAALIAASAKAGAFVAKAGIKDVNAIEDFAMALGLLFQMSDDLLDYTSTKEQIGKTPGKDGAVNKLTFLSLFGPETARQKIAEFKQKTLLLLEPFGEKANLLRGLTEYVAGRTS